MGKRFEIRRQAGVLMEVWGPKSDLAAEFATWDLNPHGAFLITDATPNPGTRLTCQFSLQGVKDSFFFSGEVARVARGRRLRDRGPCGFAVRFLGTTTLERLTLRNALRGVPPPVPGASRSNQLIQAMGWS